MKISPNWPYEDQNKYWAVFCLSKVKKQVAEKELQRRTSLYYFCFLPPSWGVPRRFCLSKLTGKSASDLPRPACALKDKRTLTVGGGKNCERASTARSPEQNLATRNWSSVAISFGAARPFRSCVVAPSGGPQGHSSLHDCTGRGHIGWKRGEVVPSTNHARCVQYTAVYKA